MRPLARLRRLYRCNRGVSITEFALTVPVFFLCGGGGLEYVNYGLAHLNVSQVTASLADNASRVGLVNTLNVTQLREVDINDVLTAARLQGAGIKLTNFGRITLSSLENVQQSYDTAPVQRIHWQRCIGLKSGAAYDSTYGTTTTAAGSDATLANAGTTISAGMGDTGRKVNAPASTGVMFVEINYEYQPLFGTMFISPTVVHYSSSYIVRDNRDFSQVFNPNPKATSYTCDRRTAT